jgi:hypothetical protein
MADGARAAHVRRLGALLEAGRSGAVWTDTIDEAFVESARRDDLGPLLYHALRHADAWEAQPPHCREALTAIAREAAAVDAARLEVDRRVVAALDALGAQPLLFKGAALAHSCYGESWLRPRADTDILITRSKAADVSRELERLGFWRAARPTGEYVTHQFTYVGTVSGVRMEFDIHWKVSDPQAFADLFGHDELSRNAIPVPPLGSCARAIGEVHALLVACIHRVAHHHDGLVPLFLADIDRLARRLDAESWSRVSSLAASKRIRRVCARGLELSVDLFGTPVPSEVSRGLAAAGNEPSAAYLREGLRKVDIIVSDMRALGWVARARLLREHLLPPPAYVMASYGTTRTALLPALYLHRIASGAFKWFRPLGSR